MKRSYTIGAIGAWQILLICLHIHMRTKSVALLYDLQRKTAYKKELIQQKQLCSYSLKELQSPQHIEKIARESLHMKPITLHSVKRLESNGTC